jgi:hypothetical protein
VAALYPGTWLSTIVPVYEALPLLMFIECCLGGWFASLLFRSWDLNLCASAAGGILFVSACLLGQTFIPPQASTILWLPWEVRSKGV